MIGKVIKKIREQRHITLAELSELSGIQTATLSRIENEKTDGRLNHIIAIAKAFDMKLSEFFALTEEPTKLSKEQVLKQSISALQKVISDLQS